jgi:hypothetical protein
MEGLMEITKNLSQVSWPPERDFNQGRPEYEVGVLTTRPRRSVSGRGGEKSICPYWELNPGCPAHSQSLADCVNPVHISRGYEQQIAEVSVHRRAGQRSVFLLPVIIAYVVFHSRFYETVFFLRVSDRKTQLALLRLALRCD